MSSSSNLNNYEIHSSNLSQDLEKKENAFEVIAETDSWNNSDTNNEYADSYLSGAPSLFIKIMQYLDFGEYKGISPVTDAEKTDRSLYKAATMWLSANMVVSSFAVGVLGVTVFQLNFVTCFLTIFFFAFLGALPCAYFSVFGAATGLRQMVLSRYLCGNITARVFAFINCCACVGWGAVNSIASAELLTMINAPHNCPPWAGCLIIIIGTWVITFFGHRIIHLYEKWSWLPNFIIFLIIIGRIAKKGTFTNGAWEGGATTAGNVLSFGSICFGLSIGWVTYISDYTCYMPRDTNKIALFSSVLTGIMFPAMFAVVLGAAAAAATIVTPEWNALYNSNGTGGMIYAILVDDSLHGFGQFCCVLLGLSTIANNVPNMYSIALGAQSVWAPLAKIPRPVWTTIGTGVTAALAIPAYYKFTSFLNDFMDCIAYCLSIYTCICLTEHFIWRKGKLDSFNVDHWDSWEHLPIGIAGCIALFVGAVGVALGMNQTYWVGEISKEIGKYGGDVGIELGVSFAFITYCATRPFELKYFGR